MISASLHKKRPVVLNTTGRECFNGGDICRSLQGPWPSDRRFRRYSWSKAFIATGNDCITTFPTAGKPTRILLMIFSRGPYDFAIFNQFHHTVHAPQLFSDKKRTARRLFFPVHLCSIYLLFFTRGTLTPNISTAVTESLSTKV